MKNIVSIALVIFFTLIPSQVWAQDAVVSSVQDSPANPNTHTTISYSMTDTIKAIANTVQHLRFRLGGDIVPIAGQPGKLNHSDLTPFNAWLNNANPHFIADSIARGDKAMIPYTSEVKQSAKYCAKLVISSPLVGPKPLTLYFLTEDSTQVSAHIEDRPDLYKNAQINGALFGLYNLPANANGQVVIDKSEKLVHNISVEDCGGNISGEPIAQKITNIDSTASFPEGSEYSLSVPFGNIIEKLIDEVVKARLDVTKKARVANDFLVALHSLAAIPKHLTDEFIAANRGSMDGWPASFLPEKAKKPAVTTAIAENELALGGNVGKPKAYDDPNLHDNGANSALKSTACIVQPHGLNGKLAIGNGTKNIPLDNCAPKVVGQCPIDIIEQGATQSQASCSLTNTSDYTSLSFLNILVNGQNFTFADALPNGIPPLMKKVLEAAGSTYNVPASVLLGTMLEEGSFNHAGTWDWTDENVKKYSDCTIKDPMPSCDEFAHPVSGSKGAFGFIQTYWDQVQQNDGVYEAVADDPAWKEILATMPKENITQCNFVDAAFAAAKTLGEDHSHYQPAYVPPAPLSCTVQGSTYNTNITSVPSSCSDWDNNRVALARLQYSNRECDLGIYRMVTTFQDH